MLFVVEVRGDDELARGGEAEAAADVVEASGDGEGGGGEDDGGVVVEEGGGEEFGDVDGGGLQVGVEGGVSCAAGEVADSSGGAALDPEDGVAVGGFEEEGEVGADVGGAFAQAGGLFDVLEVVEFAFEASECVEDAECSSRRSLRGRLRGCGRACGRVLPGSPGVSVGRIAKNMRERSLRVAQALSMATVLAFFGLAASDSTSRTSSSMRWLVRPMPK